jgi:multidrug efflux pump subunit AcrB
VARPPSARSGTPPSSPGPARPAASIVRLRDVARVELGAQNYNQSCTFDGRPSVGLSVYQLPGTNALDVADRVRARMSELRARFPDGVDYDIAYDTTPFIRESVADVVRTLLEAVVLVGLASKNAILIVEFAKQQQEGGVPPRKAVLEASRLRLRPILMTSFAFIFGVLPLVMPRGPEPRCASRWEGPSSAACSA